MKIRKELEQIFNVSFSKEQTVSTYIKEVDKLGKLDLSNLIKVVIILATRYDEIENS